MIQITKMFVVDENHLALSFLFGEKEFMTLIQYKSGYYEIKHVFHDYEGECPICLQKVSHNVKTICLNFVLNEEEIDLLEKTIQQYLTHHLFKGNDPQKAVIVKKEKSERANRYKKQLFQLLSLSIKREEEILFYAEDFSYYIAKDKDHKVFINGEIVTDHFKQNEWIEAAKIMSYIKGSKQNKSVLHHLELEKEIISRFDVKETKRNKLVFILDALKRAILMYNTIYKKYEGDSFNELITYLNEVLYKEIPLLYQSEEEFFACHERASKTIHKFAQNNITFEECLELLVQDPYCELGSRKERIIFTIKSMKKMGEILLVMQKLKVDFSYLWYEDMYNSLFHYLTLELGISYKSNAREREELQLFLQVTLEDFFTEKQEEIETYKIINSKIPFVKDTVYEKINRFLQEESKKYGGYIYYLMEITTLENKVTNCDFFGKKENKELKRWIKEDVKLEQFKELIDAFLKENGFTIGKSAKQSNQTEYILWDEHETYKLHFREKR